jgi:4-hydroxy-tetrahydrodipicolinate reductase
MKIIIGGALGRMGRVLAEIAKSAGVEVVCGVDAAYQNQAADYPMVSSCDRITKKADALIDFSVAANLDALLQYAQKAKIALVLCVTGYTDQQFKAIARASKQIPILQSANMSFGIHVLAQLAATAARALGNDFDIEIIEKHHNRKIDSPSGTALMLSDAIRKERKGLSPVFGRCGRLGERRMDEIGIHAVRGGTVSGEHEVGFYGNAEEIIITHRAENRALFAKGALRGAAFLIQQPPGLYTMRDVVTSMIQ